MTIIRTKLPDTDVRGGRDLMPLIQINGYAVHPVLFNAMLADPERGRALLASIAESDAEGIGCNINLDTPVGRRLQRIFTAAERLFDTLNEQAELAAVANAVIRECCIVIFG